MKREELIFGIIQNNPAIRYNDIMRKCNLKNGTLTHYLHKLENTGKIIVERTPRVTHFFDTTISKNDTQIHKFLSQPTLRQIVILLLHNGTLTFSEIRDGINKSAATTSVSLNRLFRNNVIEKSYDIPSNKYSLKNCEGISKIITQYYQHHTDKLTVCK